MIAAGSDADRRVAMEWRRAKLKALDAGQVTQWDRRTAALIRERQRDGVAVTDAQVEFADRVEAIVADRKKTCQEG